MIRELAWYIESGRFTDIVKELEEKAEAYASALSSGDADIHESGEAFRALCKWHMRRSGWRTDEADSLDAATEFFNGAEINRKALDRFEKEIIKAHMYQKHLWEFMGTTGSMTVISKTAMKRDGFDHSKYLPIEYKKSNPPKSPLSRMLKKTPHAVPIYQYLDGSVSSEYDKERAEARFDTLKDKSGFDWSGSGWDPNYEVDKNGWHGEYDSDDVWTLVHESEPTARDTFRSTAEARPPIELIRDGKGAILYDPGRALLSPAMRAWLLDDGSVYGAEKIDPGRTAELIRNALGRMGAENITAVCAGTGTEGEADPHIARTMAEYRAALGDLLSPDAYMSSEEATEAGRQKFLDGMRTAAEARAGTELFRSIHAAVTNGARGDAAIQYVRSGTARIPLSLYNAADRKAAGLTEEDEKQILSYDVPEKKRALLSTTALGLLKEERLLATGGVSRKDILDMAHEYATQGKKPEKTVSVETTFSRLCTEPDSGLPCEKVEEEVHTQLEAARAAIPKQETAEKQHAADAAISAVIRNFAAVRMSTGMTPEEAVNAAVRTVGGKAGKSHELPQGKIEYVTHSMAGRDDGQRRIFMDIPLNRLVQRAAETPPQTKEATIQSIIASVKIPKKTYNLLSETERNAWYKSKAFRDSGLSVEQAESLAAEELERIRQSPMTERQPVVSVETELDERHGFSQTQDLRGTASVKIVPAALRLNATDAAAELNRNLRDVTVQTAKNIPPASKQADSTYNLLSKAERAEFYKTEEFQESGLSEQDANDFVLAYGQQDGLSATSRALLVDAVLFGKAVRHAKNGGTPASFADAVTASRVQEATDSTYNLLSEVEREEFYKTEEYIASGIGRAEIEEAVREYERAAHGNPKQDGHLIIDTAAFARAVKEAGVSGIVQPQEMREILKRSSRSRTSAEPFKAWNPDSVGTPTPTFAAFVQAEKAMQARESILSKKNAGRVMEQERSARDFLFQTQRHTDTDGNSFTANDIMLERAEIRSPQTTERQNQLKFAHRGRQDVGTGRNFSPETDRMHEQTGIPPRQPTGQQNTREFYPQDQQNAKTYKNSAPRTRRNAMTNGNPATEKSGGTKNTVHGMLAGEEREGQDADTRRVERLNAAYERDRASLAKTDPAFSRGMFRDVGHAEGSDETNGNVLRKILSIEKTNFMVDLEKEKETDKKE